LKDNPDYNEKWLQERISEDPSILGLGDLEVRAVVFELSPRDLSDVGVTRLCSDM